MTDRGYLHLVGDGVVRIWNSAAYHYTPRATHGAFFVAHGRISPPRDNNHK